jgi:lipoate-protein ligase A
LRSNRPQINPDKLTIVPTSSRRAPLAPDTAYAAWPQAWQTLESGPQDGVRNMATDLALLAHADRVGAAVLRTYTWARPTVSFGRNEPVRGAWDVAAMAAAGYDVVRRPTGGRALLHAEEVTFSVVMRLSRTTPWRQVYDAVNTRLLDALLRLGVPAARCEAEAAPIVAPDGPACFAAPAVGELAVGGRKLVGSAVWRTPAAYLQHGSILLHDTQDALARFRLDAVAPEPPAQATALDQWLAASGPPLASRVLASLHDAWRAPGTTGETGLSAFHPSAAFDTDVARHAEPLRDPAWLWRR